MTRSSRAVALALALTPLVGVPTASAAPAAAEQARQQAADPAWVRVSVARLWETPSSPRRVDRPMLGVPVKVLAWLRDMSLDQRRALSSHSDTEAIMGERVLVLQRERHGGRSWSQVVVPDQPSQKDPRGYPGWVPSRQLTGEAPRSTGTLATVTERTTTLRRLGHPRDRLVPVSAGTSLPYLRRDGRFVRALTPSGRRVLLASDDVSVHPTGTPALPPSRRGLVRSARTFTGEWYLWGGLSGFGIDCSGLTWMAHRLRGMTIPRDALPQSQSGTPVERSALRRGDLLFAATDGLVHHVVMWAGPGKVIQARATGTRVATGPVSWYEYAGARRYLR